MVVATPEEVPADVEFDVIWSNPPIRVGKDALHELLQTWLPRLAPSGAAYLVVQKNLGADSLHRWLDEEPRYGVPAPGQCQGLPRVLEVTRAAS